MFSNHKDNNNTVAQRKRTYNVIFNSNFASGATASSRYYVDWTIMPEGEYKVTFTFTSVATATDLDNSINACLYLDLGQSNTSVIEASPTNSTYALVAQRSQFLGCLRPTEITIMNDYITYLYADINTNPPVYLFCRPKNSAVTVDIHTSSVTTTTNYAPTSAYVLTLSFELQ